MSTRWTRILGAFGRGRVALIGQRQGNRRAQARVVVVERDPRVVAHGDRADQAQAQAAALGAAVAFAAVEAVEHAVALVLGDAGAAVAHHDAGVRCRCG